MCVVKSSYQITIIINNKSERRPELFLIVGYDVSIILLLCRAYNFERANLYDSRGKIYSFRGPLGLLFLCLFLFLFFKLKFIFIFGEHASVRFVCNVVMPRMSSRSFCIISCL